MNRYIKYARVVLTHKWYVFLECCKLGIPWRGVVHDLSKFMPREFKHYARWFHTPSLVDGSAYKQFLKGRFDVAWLHHQKRNPHHPEYWILASRGKPDVALPMSDVYRREMLADWRGASRAYAGDSDVTAWYLGCRDEMRLHPDTRAWIEGQLGL